MTTVFILFEREDRARQVRIFGSREDAEAERQRIQIAEACDDVPEFRRSVLFIEERRVE